MKAWAVIEVEYLVRDTGDDAHLAGLVVGIEGAIDGALRAACESIETSAADLAADNVIVNTSSRPVMDRIAFGAYADDAVDA